MTDIEQKALALVNEEPGYSCCHLGEVSSQLAIKALCRAIKQHEAFQQEVSDAVEAYRDTHGSADARLTLYSFIIAKPDPLIEVFRDMDKGCPVTEQEYAYQFRAAIEKRGGKITWGEG